MISEGFLWCDTVSQEHMVCGPERSFPTTSYFRGKRLYKILASWNFAYTLLIIAVPLFPICLTPRNPLPFSLTNNYRLLPRSLLSDELGPDLLPLSRQDPGPIFAVWDSFLKLQDTLGPGLWVLSYICSRRLLLNFPKLLFLCLQTKNIHAFCRMPWIQ